MTIELEFFDVSEFDCQETGANSMDRDFLLAMDELRRRCGFPFHITSGYRAETHTIERAKMKPGVHTEGIAADVRVRGGYQRAMVVKTAIELGFKGIGVNKDFVHVDFRPHLVMWTYD